MVVRQESKGRALAAAAAVSADSAVLDRTWDALPGRPAGGALALGIAAQAASFKSRGAGAKRAGGARI